jgi:hypothetical protein
MPIRRLFPCIVLLGCLAFTAFDCALNAQNTIPPGTIIPVVLSHAIDSHKNKPGQPVVAQVAQDVPLGQNAVLRRRTKILGEITQVESNSGRTTIGLRLDRIKLRQNQIAITTQLRAIADFMSILDAQRPTNAVGGKWNSPSAWTTVQIGGDVVYRGGGPVQSRTGEIVGTPTPCVVEDQCGVLDRVKSTPDPECAGTVADDTHPQAMWVFSADACGIYGFSDLRFQNGSTIFSAGQIFFSAEKRVKLPSGTGLLLTVTGTQTGAER